MARENNRPSKRPEENDGIIKKLIAVNRVTKVVKGGRNMRFSALVVVGDGNGKIGVAMGKANEVPEAIEKATQRAKKSMTLCSLVGNTIPHEVLGKFGRGSVLMMPAKKVPVLSLVVPFVRLWNVLVLRTLELSLTALTILSTALKQPLKV